MVTAAWAILYVSIGMIGGIVLCLALDTFSKGNHNS